jgi:hypothetical protein
MTVPRTIITMIAIGTVAVPSLAAGRTLYATLRGQSEVPGPGKNDARGSATVTVNNGSNRVCYTVRVRNLPRPTMAHIHRGAVGVAGPPVVTLRTPVTGLSNGCARVPRALARDIFVSPRRFYVNVHSRAFPDGAIRGQLTR